ncbi:tRNA (adenosine(37)-N6)-threonylcarbamoyltransferase complex transferase subunit TsaD [bacterium]|nr:tRNA (adenosine(37)-N6)-threonylcarbamoyltransferase complex transferase subunit TsaD [bacterium]
MIVLGIETSCDDTSAAVLKNGALLSNVISSQAVHRQFGGIVPELASRAHIQVIMQVIGEALDRAGIGKHDLEGIAVTCGPGLAGSLLVGLSAAKGLALSLGIPFRGVNHLEGHLMATRLEATHPEPPFIVLIVSGGHTQIVLVERWGAYTVLGRTRDDAAGEAFDKTAKLLGLTYPGGPVIEREAARGDSGYVRFPRADLGDTYEFSFSGLKTAVLNHVRTRSEETVQRHLQDICRCFQDAVVDVLTEKTLKAAVACKVRDIALAGGVAVNGALRQRMKEAADAAGMAVHWPSPALCTDNGAMIASAGAFYLEKGDVSPFSLSPHPSLNL